jgi:cysteine desulfuration protein SufE
MGASTPEPQASIEAAIEGLADEFALFTDWEERYGYLIDLGRTLEPLDASERNDATKVRGCASQVWLVAERGAAGQFPRLHFRGDSDAHIVRGLIAVLLRVFSDRAPTEILSVAPQAAFDRLGLASSLTPQRSNGFMAMVERIRKEAAAMGEGLGISRD